jgi:hypothetical protein
MNDKASDLDQIDDDILTEQTSDEDLEAAADELKMTTVGPGSCGMPGGGRVC